MSSNSQSDTDEDFSYNNEPQLIKKSNCDGDDCYTYTPPSLRSETECHFCKLIVNHDGVAEVCHFIKTRELYFRQAGPTKYALVQGLLAQILEEYPQEMKDATLDDWVYHLQHHHDNQSQYHEFACSELDICINVACIKMANYFMTRDTCTRNDISMLQKLKKMTKM